MTLASLVLVICAAGLHAGWNALAKGGRDPVVFLLWGGYAQKKAKLIDGKRHLVIKGVHPSPLSARNGFFGSKPFSTINNALEDSGSKPVDWALPAK